MKILLLPMRTTVSLNNNITMPQLGLGVWQSRDGQEVMTAVSAALENGYRLIDTAAVYGNEKGVGKAIAVSNVPRNELFITTKLWNSDHGYTKTLQAFEESRKRLGLDYIDLYLIHWPVPAQDKYIDTWRALEELYNEGKVRAIGVSNFTVEHLTRLLEKSSIVPAVNQIELHPYFPQHELREFCKAHGIAVESWSPLGGGGSSLLSDPVIESIADKYGVSGAQVIIRWHIEQGLIVIPKSVRPDRIRQNYDVFNFSLDKDDLMAVAELNSGTRIGPDPVTANFT